MLRVGDLNVFWDIHLLIYKMDGVGHAWARGGLPGQCYQKKHAYNGLGPGLHYEILGLKELVGAVHASGSAIESGTSNFKLSCKTLYLYLSYKISE